MVDAVGGIDDISSKDRPGISMPRMGGMDIPPPNMLEDIIDELVELLENEELLEKEDFIMLLLDEEPPMDMPPMPDIILLIMSSIEGIIAPPPPNIGIFMSSIPAIFENKFIHKKYLNLANKWLRLYIVNEFTKPHF